MPSLAVSRLFSWSLRFNVALGLWTDSFSALDTTKIQQSHKHPTLVTVTVDGYQGHHGTASPPIKYPEHHWRLPNTDPRNEGKFLFRLHTLDIYFWTNEDANSFIDTVGKFLQQQQLEILDAPQPPVTPEQVMSPVVQQLENVAIQDPAYHNGQTRSSGPVAPSFSPPAVASDRQADAQNVPKVEDPGAYQPLAYNPAAPPAPEPIKHREKTPPPPESEAGTGLAAAAYHDQTKAAISSSMQQQTSLSPSYSHMQVPQGYVSSHQEQGRKNSYASPPLSTGYVNSPPSVQEHRASSVSYFPPAPPPSGGNPLQPYANAVSFAPPPQSAGSSPLPQSKPISTQDPNPYLYGKEYRPPDSPATEILGNSYVGGPPQPLQHLQPKYADYLETRRQSQKPEGGYSDYQYTQSPQHHQHQHHSHSNEYDVHNQVYKPTEEEAHKHKHRKHSESHSGQSPGKLEQRADKVEKGVNRLFKKLEKKIG